MTEKILILDFGSQYTQLIARAIREANVYCEIVPYHHKISYTQDLKGVILSGSPFSVNDDKAPEVNIKEIAQQRNVLGICYGAQLTSKQLGGRVERSEKREYEQATVCAITDSIPVAAFQLKENGSNDIYGLQFHPEVYHSSFGKQIIQNFLYKICGCKGDWTPAHFISDTVEQLKKQIGDKKVVMALSGGVDSTVAATLIHKAIGKNLYGIFVDNGVLRKGEYESVLETYAQLDLNVKGVNAKKRFYDALNGLTNPEEKRKAIGKTFIDVFDHESHQLQDISFLGQGTIYPDVIESVSVHGPSVTIKSHHNVGGLPDTMKLSLVEPLRFLFKDEVRKVGLELGIPHELLFRHPFPGPGLAIRILGEITKEKVGLLQEADKIYIEGLKEHHLYDKVWQAGAILLPVKSVGVMGDEYFC